MLRNGQRSLVMWRKKQEEQKGKGGVFGRGVIAGGCCKSSFDEIRALRRFVDSQ